MTDAPPNSDEPLLRTFAQVTYPTWRAQVERALKGAEFDRRLVSRTLEGIDVQPLYTADSAPSPDALGAPGQAPYRRGSLPEGRHGALWNMRPRYEHPDPDVVRREIVDDLGRGARSIWLRFDRAVRTGRTPAEAPAAPNARGVGFIDAAQLSRLLADVPSERVTVSLDAGGNAFALAACFVAAVKQRNLRPELANVSFNADPLGALARDGELPGSLATARIQLVALVRQAAEQLPRARCVSVSTLHYHEAGAHAAQELGLGLATGVTYLRWLVDAGVPLSVASAQIGFSVAVGSDFFMEVAKLRALRECWARVIAACGGDAAAQRCELHAVTSDRTKTARDPWVNLLRETTETFAAAVAGADAITNAGFDRTIGPSDAFARRIAGNTHVILDEEAHVAQVADPAGGAYYVESLTQQLAERAWAQLQAIEARGGFEHALRDGSVARELTTSADARARLIATRKQAITGVSEFADIHEERPLRTEPDFGAIARARKAAIAAMPQAQRLKDALTALQRSDTPDLPAAIELAGAGANLEQLSAALWRGAAPERIEALPRRTHAQPFERLRDACDAAAERPAVFLCNLGPIPEHKARAQFASGLFQAGGLRVIDNDGFVDAEAAAAAFAASGAQLCALCGSDEAYPRFVEGLAPLLRDAGAKSVVLAGRFGSAEASYRAAGVTDSIYAGCNAIEILTRLLASAGVTP